MSIQSSSLNSYTIDNDVSEAIMASKTVLETLPMTVAKGCKSCLRIPDSPAMPEASL